MSLTAGLLNNFALARTDESLGEQTGEQTIITGLTATHTERL